MGHLSGVLEGHFQLSQLLLLIHQEVSQGPHLIFIVEIAGVGDTLVGGESALRVEREDPFLLVFHIFAL